MRRFPRPFSPDNDTAPKNDLGIPEADHNGVGSGAADEARRQRQREEPEPDPYEGKNLTAAVSLGVKMTPTMAAGVADHVWALTEIAALSDPS